MCFQKFLKEILDVLASSASNPWQGIGKPNPQPEAYAHEFSFPGDLPQIREHVSPPESHPHAPQKSAALPLADEAWERSGLLRCRPVEHSLAPPSPKQCRPELQPPRLGHLAREARFQPGQMAGLLHVSGRHLRRLIRTFFGCSVRELLNRLRLELAKELLLAHELLKNIAVALSLADSHSFCHFFKGREGLTPSEYIVLHPLPDFFI